MTSKWHPHSTEGEYLQEMILKKISRHSIFIIKCTPILYGESLSRYDMNLSYAITIPISFLFEPEISELTDEIFTQVMINSINLIFSEIFLKLQIEMDGCSQIMSKWFLNHDTSIREIKTDRSETFCYGNKVLWTQTKMVSNFAFSRMNCFKLIFEH